MPRLTLSNCELHYHDLPAQSGNDAVLLLLHANPGSSQDYAAVMSALNENRRIIAVDWPGYGGASCFTQPLGELGEISPIMFYDMVVALLDQLNITRCDVIGNSIGGNVAARLAAQHPDKVGQLVLVSPGGFTQHNPFTKAFCRYQGSRIALPAHWFAQLYLRRRTDTTRAMLQRAKSEQSGRIPTQLSRAMWQSFKTSRNDVLSMARQITAPTTLIFGWYDPIIPAITDGRQAEKSIANAKLHVLSCGHAAFAELPEQFLAIVAPQFA